MWNFGRGDYGLCPSGNGTAVASLTPCDSNIFSGLRVVSVSGCYYHALAITEDERVWSWGYNGNGALGHSKC
jgi:alpha-tubulin suppressor-like RCC1 family protein